MTITVPPVPSQVTDLYDVLDRLGTLGDQLVCAALLRAVSTIEGLALREVAAVDAHGSHVEVGQVVRRLAGAGRGGLHHRRRWRHHPAGPPALQRSAAGR